MRAWSTFLLVVGVGLVITGVFMWQMDHRTPAVKLSHVLFPLAPAWSLIVMGWTGLVGEHVLRRWREESVGS